MPVPLESDRDKKYWTPHRVRLFSQAAQLSDFPAQVMKALEPVLFGCRSALDVGAGVGALTVPLAKRIQHVTALEPSATMMEELKANLARNHLDNVTCLPAAWEEATVTAHDLILVANVAPIFKDLFGFLTAAESLAGDALALVQNVGPGTEKFYFGELYPLLLGRHYPPREDYLNTLTLLHSLGIYANMQIVSYQFDQPFATLQDAVDFWTEQMHLTESNQQRKLRAFLQARLQPTGSHLIAPMRRRSAVIWWRVTSKDSL
jgi:SAM-dependent methyltransferase